MEQIPVVHRDQVEDSGDDTEKVIKADPTNEQNPVTSPSCRVEDTQNSQEDLFEVRENTKNDMEDAHIDREEILDDQEDEEVVPPEQDQDYS